METKERGQLVGRTDLQAQIGLMVSGPELYVYIESLTKFIDIFLKNQKVRSFSSHFQRAQLHFLVRGAKLSTCKYLSFAPQQHTKSNKKYIIYIYIYIYLITPNSHF